jgi:hypothetical protein
MYSTHGELRSVYNFFAGKSEVKWGDMSVNGRINNVGER